MSGKDSNRMRNKTISFRVSEAERKNLEARIESSGLTRSNYYLHSCLYGRIVVVGSREHIDRLIEALNEMELMLKVLAEDIENEQCHMKIDEIQELKEEYIAMLKAILNIASEAVFSK